MVRRGTITEPAFPHQNSWKKNSLEKEVLFVPRSLSKDSIIIIKKMNDENDDDLEQKKKFWKF